MRQPAIAHRHGSKKAAYSLSTILFTALFVCGGMLASCGSDVLYAETESVSRDGWPASDTLTFSPEIATSDDADLYLWVRHSRDYPFSNLWLKVMGDSVLTGDRDGMMELILAEKDGRWLGTCSQSLCTIRVLLKPDVGSPGDASYRLSVLQYMRQDPLPGIRDVGVEVIRREPGT